MNYACLCCLTATESLCQLHQGAHGGKPFRYQQKGKTVLAERDKDCTEMVDLVLNNHSYIMGLLTAAVIHYSDWCSD